MTFPRRDAIFNKLMARVVVRHDKTYDGTPCWEYTGPTSGEGRGGGYGRACIEGVTVSVHRVMYTHFHGYIPPKRHVDHKCGNRICCSPHHTESVTGLQNQRRKNKK